MARTKNAKRARVEGECSASARLVASSHYMARWLPSLRALNKYLEKFKSIVIVPPRYITVDFIHGRHYNLVWNALQTQHLVRTIYSTLNYVVPKSDKKMRKPMEKYPDAQEPQVQGQPQDPEVQAQSQESPPPPPPSPTM
ncbi:hypothetical protein HN51_035758 [Arachis hypogaea]